MRLKCGRALTIAVVIVNVLFVYYCFRIYTSLNANSVDIEHKPHILTTTKSSVKKLSKLITVLIREFENNENDVTLTAQSFVNLFPNIIVWILYDETPYPPLDLVLTNNSLENIKVKDLSPNVKGTSYLMSQIDTKYVLFVPDSTRITSRQLLYSMLEELERNSRYIVVQAVNGQKIALKCLKLNLNVREWTLKYITSKGAVCDGVHGKHIILLRTELLRKLYDPFLMPFPQSLYIQSAAQNIQVRILKGTSLYDGKSVIKSHHSQWRKKQKDHEHYKKFFSMFKIKQVVRETGLTEWYGCGKETPRCFGPVIDSMPSYLYEKKWTPPCCLSNLRKTARHVFAILDEAGIRYWLEAGSLLGAMRSGDVLPWDYNVDVGFIRDDFNRSKILRKSKDKPTVDKKGFLWEKATEGNFYRVHFSKVNKIHVNLFPFFSKNGTMVRDSWFTSHKNMEFSESFLHPMSSIDFAGRNVPSPNNIRDFLELKFGKGSIETPEYPDPSKLKFP